MDITSVLGHSILAFVFGTFCGATFGYFYWGVPAKRQQ